MDASYILIATGLLGLAIAYNLWGRPRGATGLHHWVTRDLYRGDLHALAAVARGGYFDVNLSQAKRLHARGFLAKSRVGEPRVTLKGRLVLLLRATIAKDKVPAKSPVKSP